MARVGAPAGIAAWVCLLVSMPPAAAHAASDPPNRAIVGVVTPGWHPRTIEVVRRMFPEGLIGAFGVNLARHADSARMSRRLTEFMAGQEWDPVPALEDAVVAALEARRVTTRRIVVVRQSAGGRSALRREDVPEDAGVDAFLDVDIRSLFLSDTDDGGRDYRPGLAVQFLWITPAGRPVGMRRSVVFDAGPARGSRAGVDGTPVGSSVPEAAAPSAECVFAGAEAIEADVHRFRGCMQRAIENAARQIAESFPAAG